MNILMTETQCQPTQPIRIRVNGDVRQVASGTTVSKLIEQMGLVPERLAVELDRSIVKRNLWDAAIVNDGAEIEIVQFVGGG